MAKFVVVLAVDGLYKFVVEATDRNDAINKTLEMDLEQGVLKEQTITVLDAKWLEMI